MKLSNLRHNALKLATVSTAALVAAGNALATAPTIPDGTAMITAISDKQGGYATVMFTLAVIGVGIMVGVKWIKRGRGAA